MNEFKSSSGCGQDKFVYNILPKRDGTFIDIGCSDLVNSNSYGLEQIGWRGILVDNKPGVMDGVIRHSPFFAEDATAIKWTLVPGVIDYLSLDVDEDSLTALLNLPLKHVRFRVITIEHDEYSNGPEPRTIMRAHLTLLGYELICSDVQCYGLDFEDWWVDPELSDLAEKYRCSHKEWDKIV